MCDLARAHGEKVSPPKDNCTFASLEIQVIYGFFISSIFVSKITKLLGQLIFWKGTCLLLRQCDARWLLHTQILSYSMPETCSNSGGIEVQVLGLFCCELELTSWFSKRWNPPIAWAYPKISLGERDWKKLSLGIMLSWLSLGWSFFIFLNLLDKGRPAVFQFWALFTVWHAEHWSLPHQEITWETINLELTTPYTSLFLSRLENFKRETVDAHDPAPADIVNIPLPHSTCFRPVCNTPSPPWNVRWTRMILHAPKRALKRCHLTCIQNLPGATSPLKSHQQLPTKIGHLAFISLFPYNDYCVYLSHGKCMIRGYLWTCYFFP